MQTIKGPSSLLYIVALICTSIATGQDTYVLDEDTDKWILTEPFEPDSPEGQLAAASRQLAEGNYPEALKLSESWLNQYKNHELLPEALLIKGDALFAQEEYYKSLFPFEKLARNRHSSARVLDVMVKREYEIAKLFLSGTKRLDSEGQRNIDATDEGVELLIRIQERQPASRIAELAAFELANYYFQIPNMSLTKEMCEIFLQNYPNSKSVTRVNTILEIANSKLKDQKKHQQFRTAINRTFMGDLPTIRRSLNFGIYFSRDGNFPELSPTKTADEILDSIYSQGTRVLDSKRTNLAIEDSLDRAWLASCLIRTELLRENFDREELSRRINQMINWTTSENENVNSEQQLIERISLLGLAIAYSEGVDNSTLAKKALNSALIILNKTEKELITKKLIQPFVAGFYYPVCPIDDPEIITETFLAMSDWLVSDINLLPPRFLPWLDFAHAYLLMSRRLPDAAISALPSPQITIPEESFYLLFDNVEPWGSRASPISKDDPFMSQVSQRWAFETINAVCIYLLQKNKEEKDEQIQVIITQFDDFPKDLYDDLNEQISGLMTMPLPAPSILESMKTTDLTAYTLISFLNLVKSNLSEDKSIDIITLITLITSEKFQNDWHDFQQSSQ